MNKATRKELESMIIKLQKYCHGKNCKNTSKCPKECECKKKLDLDTSMAWNAGFILIGYSAHVIELNEIKIIFKEYIQILHLHVEKYRSLYELIVQIKRLLNEKG